MESVFANFGNIYFISVFVLGAISFSIAAARRKDEEKLSQFRTIQNITPSSPCCFARYDELIRTDKMPE
ncbi:hypothetical protein [Bdellovibrio sp. BCCA]|uniref:hypothetical protein n=1 Tax=Bdellovibrio sp. BCCA TaxID=3136281 RepID=UPI0030F07B5E